MGNCSSSSTVSSSIFGSDEICMRNPEDENLR